MVAESVALDVIVKESVDVRLDLFGYNKLEEKKESKFLMFLEFIWNLLSWVMEAAAIIAIVFTQRGVDGFACILPEQKYEILKRLQARKYICEITGDGVNNAPILKNADIGIAVADSTDVARSASDIVLTEPGLSVIISAVLTSRVIFQRMKNYTIYAVSITIFLYCGFMLLAVFWKCDFPPFMVLVIVVLNDGTIMTISKDRIKPSPVPDSSKLSEIFVIGGCPCRSRGWSFMERPGLLLVAAFVIVQLIATVISATATWKFTNIRSIGWAWTGGIWLFNIATYMLLDPIKFATAFTSKKDFGKESREAAWAAEQRMVHGLQSVERKMFSEKNTFRDINLMAEEAKTRAEIARLRELHTLKGKVESCAKLKSLDIDAIKPELHI
ncbi:hypothetical protein M0R45_034944 [Rubus argutus]|uniref:Cation-transporting P-type ATPase N-terminal domain-containing protein n=1 Tax=Rubus argutus TaxID=59490 RepID=A0AAW1VVB9_RUBAR